MDDVSKLTGPFLGQSGGTYLRVPELSPRVDGLLRVLAVVAADGRRSRRGDPQPRQILGLLSPSLAAPAAEQALSSELDALERLSKAGAAVPGRRLHERLGGPVPGGIVDWCPVDLEQWWGGVALEAEGYRNLCLVMAEVCRRVADWSAAARGDMAIGQTPPRVRPRGVLRTVGGRWLLSGFGASVQALLGVEDAGAQTEVMTASSHYQPPEELFLARSEYPMAALTWAVGSTFFALLKMRALLNSVQLERRADLPAGGTDSPHLGSHRAVLVADLLQRKPALFVDRSLDARQFLYPDRLPDRDRRTVADALSGLLGGDQPVAEAALARDCLKVLDNALAIDPARRYVDPLVMAGDFEGLARGIRQARSKIAAAGMEPIVGAMGAEEIGAEEIGADISDQDPDEDVLDAPTENLLVEELVPLEPPDAVDPPPGLPGSTALALPVPAWVKGTLGGLVVGQVLTLFLVGLLWSRGPQPVVDHSRLAPVSALLEDVGGATSAAEEPVDEAPAAEVPVIHVAADSGSVEPAASEPAASEPAASEPAASEPAALEPAAVKPPPAKSAPAKSAPVKSSSARSSSARSSSARSSSASKAESPSTVSISGSPAMLEGPAGRVSPGQVDPGTYTVLIKQGENWVAAGSVTVGAGQHVVVKCGFGRCKQQ